ncbi:hypothetical protein SJAG_06097 [Schizosaccharomyces japonicus yFS275]|uniref:Uncharacterized protein n=1 Tax=Schizosaccharomyces japonicus (strain yFS275 / FY16936) TaxID=402676 RepID=T0RSU3_SCHJY|nr:hypothetical protein SJAG_06097 [Schizosaccharomyces japonicus yFS275]EQC53005.1 hypothetical protein SJAG_06097 [Schizosaccharomyces japonicus yFS275]
MPRTIASRVNKITQVLTIAFATAILAATIPFFRSPQLGTHQDEVVREQTAASLSSTSSSSSTLSSPSDA